MIRCFGKSRPGENNILRWNRSRLNFRTSGSYSDGMAKRIALGEQLQDLSGGGAKGAVARHVLRKWRSHNAALLVGLPIGSVDLVRAFVWSAPRADFLPCE